MRRSKAAIKRCIYSLLAVNDPQTVNTCSWMSNLLNCSAHLKSTADLKPDAWDWLSLKSGLPLISDAMWKMRPSTTLGISLRSSAPSQMSSLSSVISGKAGVCDTASLLVFFSSYHLSGRSSSVSSVSEPYWPTEPYSCGLIHSPVNLSLPCAFIQVTTGPLPLYFHLRRNHMKTVILLL